MGRKTICVSNVSCLCVCAEEPNEQSGEKSEDATARASRSFETNPAAQR